MVELSATLKKKMPFCVEVLFWMAGQENRCEERFDEACMLLDVEVSAFLE